MTTWGYLWAERPSLCETTVERPLLARPGTVLRRRCTGRAEAWIVTQGFARLQGRCPDHADAECGSLRSDQRIVGRARSLADARPWCNEDERTMFAIAGSTGD